MKYYEVEFTISPLSADAADLLASLAGEAGFETFEETETGLKGYVQQNLFSEDALRECIDDFPFEGTSIIYNVREAEDRDWNEQWEQEGFEPIVISDQLVIHDGRHLPEKESKVSIEIDAKLAFGTGTHETTRMICKELIERSGGTRVLDCGTGTGILSIVALKYGANEAVGYDIDEWSADNDSSVLDEVEGTFDLVLANINRNILLADMPRFVNKMHQGSVLILSGFYTSDVEILVEEAKTFGLSPVFTRNDQDWACIVLRY